MRVAKSARSGGGHRRHDIPTSYKLPSGERDRYERKFDRAVRGRDDGISDAGLQRAGGEFGNGVYCVGRAGDYDDIAAVGSGRGRLHGDRFGNGGNVGRAVYVVGKFGSPAARF